MLNLADHGTVTTEFVRVHGIDSIQLHVAYAGPEDGPPVVLLHGFPEFWYGWRHQIDALAATGYRVIVPDQRGYHLSDKPDSVRAYALDHLAGDVLGLLDALGYERVRLVGHDWGAMVAWWLAMTHPERLTRLAILNVPHPTVFQRFLRGDLQQILKSWYGGFFQLPVLPEALLSAGNFQGLARAIAGSARPGAFTAADLEHYRAAWSQPGALSAMLNWYRAFVRHAPRRPADVRVHLPTLIIWGARDVALSLAMAQESAAMCDDARLVVIDDATHWVQHDAAEQVNALLGDFLKD